MIQWRSRIGRSVTKLGGSARPIARGTSIGKKVPWERFLEWHPACHLVTGEHEPDSLHRAKLLQRLMPAVRIRGDWSIRTGKDRGRLLVQVALEGEDDALRLAEVLGAKSVRRYLGWETQREFEFSAELAERLRKALMLT